MRISKKRYACEITNRETGEVITRDLFDEKTAEGTSGEGNAFTQAKKIAKERFGKARCAIDVFPVTLSAEIDLKKAVEAGAVGAWERA